MTAKSRRRNRQRANAHPSLKKPVISDYRFYIDGKTVIVKAESEEVAQTIFDAAYGLTKE